MPTILNNRPVALDDGVHGGLEATRDTRGLSGGERTINCVSYAYTIVGPEVYGFEWNNYAQMDNYANSSTGHRVEHCAFYSKHNKFGTAPAWGACLEVHDQNGTGACIGAEVDIWTKGEDNGSRIGLDVMMAGGNDVVDQPATVGATAAIRSSVPSSNPLAYWSWGAQLRGIKEAGVQLTSFLKGGVRGIELLGQWIIGFDSSQAKVKTAIRLGNEQRIALEGTDTITLSLHNWKICFMRGEEPLFEIDINNGDLYKKGKKIA